MGGMMSNYVFVKQGAASPAIPFEFSNGDGTSMDLTGKTVTIRMRPWNSASYTINGQAAIVNTPASNGSGFYGLDVADTAVPGHYLVEWIINPGSLILPTDGSVHVIITPSL